MSNINDKIKENQPIGNGFEIKYKVTKTIRLNAIKQAYREVKEKGFIRAIKAGIKRKI